MRSSNNGRPVLLNFGFRSVLKMSSYECGVRPQPAGLRIGGKVYTDRADVCVVDQRFRSEIIPPEPSAAKYHIA